MAGFTVRRRNIEQVMIEAMDMSGAGWWKSTPDAVQQIRSDDSYRL